MYCYVQKKKGSQTFYLVGRCDTCFVETWRRRNRTYLPGSPHVTLYPDLRYPRSENKHICMECLQKLPVEETVKLPDRFASYSDEEIEALFNQ